LLFIKIYVLPLQTKSNRTFMKTSSSADTLKLIDHKNKLRVRIQLSENRKYWEKWVSKNNGKWEFLNKVSTLDGVLKSQQEIIDNNYNNLFEMVMSKK
jgi:ABC-type transport system involved in cytochrome c biogenesis ATPase subunit